MISEGSCDTKDWSNDAENSALITRINYILKYIHIANSFSPSLFIYLLFVCLFACLFICVCFDQINEALVSSRDLFQEH